jgi:hypothetical protein
LARRIALRCLTNKHQSIRPKRAITVQSFNAERTAFRCRWDAEPGGALRFHALRLHEVGMIKSSPQKIISQGTDWRFLNELKKELKV